MGGMCMPCSTVKQPQVGSSRLINDTSTTTATIPTTTCLCISYQSLQSSQCPAGECPDSSMGGMCMPCPVDTSFCTMPPRSMFHGFTTVMHVRITFLHFLHPRCARWWQQQFSWLADWMHSSFWSGIVPPNNHRWWWYLVEGFADITAAVCVCIKLLECFRGLR